jgi:hypothetical protein
MFKRITHQFTLFDFNAMRPKLKVPISRARILEAKAAFDRGEGKISAEILREVRYKLEAKYKV